MTWQHIEDRIVKPRTSRLCCLCERTIQPGVQCVARRGFDDGPMTVYMHIVCESKTRGWDQQDWECSDPAEFRRFDLGEESP